MLFPVALAMLALFTSSVRSANCDVSQAKLCGSDNGTPVCCLESEECVGGLRSHALDHPHFEPLFYFLFLARDFLRLCAFTFGCNGADP